MRKTNETTNTEPRVFYNGRYQIIRPRWNDDNTVCRFSIKLLDCGVVLFGLRLMYARGNDRPFIAFPAYKGNDNKYYEYCHCYFADEINNKIVDELESQ